MTPQPSGSNDRWSERAEACRLNSSADRYFVGLHLSREAGAIFGALVRVWGRGLLAGCDVVASSCRRDRRIERLCRWNLSPELTVSEPPIHDAAELTELAAEAALPLVDRGRADVTLLRSCALLGFEQWPSDRSGRVGCRSAVDTALLAKLTGLTVIDDFPARDLAEGGRGGPCEALGAWMLLADRGIMPGRVIRALVDIGHTTRIFLLPPRQMDQLPSHLASYQVSPGLSLLNGILRRYAAEMTTFDRLENLAVQGRRDRELLARWRQLTGSDTSEWTPTGIDPTGLLQSLADDVSGPNPERMPDALCTAVVLISERIADCIERRLPKVLPVGQLILSGPLQHHPFLNQQIRQRHPEVTVHAMEDLVATTEQWRAPAAALLGMLHVDQVPMNTPALTGTDTPRILGRITPGSPGNWHRVLSDMAGTLPDKVTLRSAI